MGSLINRILNKAPPFPIISHLNSPKSPKLVPLIPPDQSISTLNEVDNSRAPVRLWNPTSINASKPTDSLPVFPNFSYGHFLNPIYSTGFCRSEMENEEEVKGVQSDETTIWADSVKKKRKRKMNQHKYKKLRKLLRRKT
ncbi:hypothetical protein Dimus_004663 [Dionaea muscipula]